MSFGRVGAKCAPSRFSLQVLARSSLRAFRFNRSREGPEIGRSNVTKTLTAMSREQALREAKAAIDELLRIADLRVDRTRPQGEGPFKEHPLRSEQGPPVFFTYGQAGEKVPHERVKEIGRKLHEIGEQIDPGNGGLLLMQEVYRIVYPQIFPHGSNLEHAWNGVGYWQA